MVQYRARHILGGIILLLIGLVFLLDNLDVLPPDFSLHDWWPLILVVIGIYQLLAYRWFSHFSSWFLIFLGVIFLFTVQHRFGLEWDNIWRLWPVVLILLGFSIIFRRGHHPALQETKAREQSGQPLWEERVVFSGIEKEVTSQDFKGGDISVVLGSADIDLRSAKPTAAGAVLNISAVLGSCEIRLPAEWESKSGPAPCWVRWKTKPRPARTARAKNCWSTPTACWAASKSATDEAPMPTSRPDWSADERRQLSKLTDPLRIQEFLDAIPYSADPIYRCPRTVLRDRKAHCFDGAVFAAAALERIGHRPLIVEAESGARRRPPAGPVPARRLLGGGGQIQFHRPAYPRTPFPQPARTGALLL